MFLGKISAVLQFLTEHGKGGILHVEDTIYDEQVISVLETMKSKHLNAQPALADAYLTVIPQQLYPVVFEQIVVCATLHFIQNMHLALGIDAHFFRRLCTSLKLAASATQ